MALTTVEQSLLLAAYFRGMRPETTVWGSSCDQVVTLSLFFTGDISYEECARRFSNRPYVDSLYDNRGLRAEIGGRYRELLRLLQQRPDLIQGAGDLDLPAIPTYTACGLTKAGEELIPNLLPKFPAKPDFPNWPDAPRRKSQF